MKACEVTIFGQSYTLRAQMDEERIRNLADLVDTRMKTVAASLPSATALQVAVLTALDIASERASASEDGDLLGVVEEKAEAMLRLLDRAAPETQPM